MLPRLVHSRFASASILGSVLLVLAGTVVFASIPDSFGVINGCYKSSNGQLRIIDPTIEQCGPSETAISWNQIGPQGLRGPQGPKGDTGPAGPSTAGPAGLDTQMIDTVVNGPGVAEGFVTCPFTHPHVIGGGAQILDSAANSLQQSIPGLVPFGEGWFARTAGPLTSNGVLQIRAICAQ